MAGKLARERGGSCIIATRALNRETEEGQGGGVLGGPYGVVDLSDRPPTGVLRRPPTDLLCISLRGRPCFL